MTALLQGADLCIDATHPYAVEATKNIRAAAARAGVEIAAYSCRVTPGSIEMDRPVPVLL